MPGHQVVERQVPSPGRRQRRRTARCRGRSRTAPSAAAGLSAVAGAGHRRGCEQHPRRWPPPTITVNSPRSHNTHPTVNVWCSPPPTRAVTDPHVERARLDDELALVVVEAQLLRTEREPHRLVCPGRQRHALEPFELLDRLQDARVTLVHVHLGHVVAGDASRCWSTSPLTVQRPGAPRSCPSCVRFVERERRVREPVAERELRRVVHVEVLRRVLVVGVAGRPVGSSL